jgi:DNA mismatch repair protein MutL
VKRNKIQKIKDAEKIAAGEVIDRPANVVKELIENSIDAEASDVKVIIKNAGKNLIHVIDNGIGIPPDEMKLAFERHTSSKIQQFSDLEQLSTLGFRGEALASIVAVSEVEVTSRDKEHDLGYKLMISGGKILDERQVSSIIGTNIKVKNLFYNIPARKKFLKKDNTELGHISDIIQRYALAYPEIQFQLINNDLTTLNCPKSNDLKTTVFHLYGKTVAKSMESIQYLDKDIILTGLLGNGSIAKKNRNHASIFLNRRYITSEIISRAVLDAYKGVLMVGMYPFFILNIELNPSIIDFNVHPKKLEVRFEDEDYIYNKIYTIIREFIQNCFMTQESSQVNANITQYFKSTSNELENQESNHEFVINEANERTNIPSTIAQEVNDTNVIQLKVTDDLISGSGNTSKMSETYLRKKTTSNLRFPKLHLIASTGQLNNKVYVILEGKNENGEEGMFILDQHAASERINKEHFLKLSEQKKGNRQKLIVPFEIEVSPSEKYFLLANLTEIKKLGFDFEHFGGNSFVLREVPTIIEKVPQNEIVKEILSDITNIGKDRSFSEVKETIINYLSCHKSIRGGDDLTINDIRRLIDDLSRCEDPFHCAHGRPTLKFFSFKELDKLFKRIV